MNDSGSERSQSRSHALTQLANQRWRISIWLSAAMMMIYFGFILLIAYNRPLSGTLLVPGLSLGILLGALVIIAAWVLMYLYVRWANTHYDKQISRLQQGE